MAFFSKSDFWWNEVTGPKTFADKVVELAVDRKNTILRLPADLPHRDSMRSIIKSKIEQELDYTVKFFDYETDNPDNLDPEHFLLKIVCEDSHYRSSCNKTIPQYISQQNLLSNKAIWIKGISENEGKWTDLIKDRNFKNAKVIFVAEIKKAEFLKRIEPIVVVDFDEYISDYDVQIFNSFVLGDQKISHNWKNYISTMLTSLCQKDVEVSCQLAEEFDFKTDYLYDALKHIADQGQFSRRGEAEDHILSLVRNSNQDEIYRRIWKAQIQVLFPIIEQERFDYIFQFREKLQEALAKNNIEYFDERIEDPFDLETSTFCYMINKGYVSVPRDVAMRLEFLHECRNTIAHMNYCLAEDVEKLLNGK